MKLPEEFESRMKDMLGADYEAFIAGYDEPAVKSLRINRRLIPVVDYARMGGIFAGRGTPGSVDIWPGAYYYDEGGPGKSPYHDAGAFYIQEASAMLPVTLLDVDDRGMRVLDLCAAPGGKTTQIADLMNGRGLLVANEYVPSRASVLSENIERMGVRNALVVSADPKDIAERFPLFFDRILVDAPCSGEGMFRKNPEAVSEWSPENVAMCADRQDMILDCAAMMLAPGGKIVYSTCTFSPEEDEGSVERFLTRHPEYEICDKPHRLYPHTFRGEGHFAVSMGLSTDNRNVNGSGFSCNLSAGGRKDIGQDPFSFRNFLDETLNKNGDFYKMLSDNTDRLLEFGDSLYLAPEFMPDIKGLKVYRAGIKLGTFKKNRFEPDHALSHVLTVGDVNSYVNLAADSNEVRQYLSGMTINCDRDMKGWCLVCVDAFPLGWGKAAGGVVKNHYPKGLRK
ncbi:MAG: RsmF rRNA methyltransferase first C-terminal domain-containing protein [Lachnospiraceae bacterium]|nr:RsmF rRNA methyltransferase first C-terminal domain-containing protein [Lachnospiraceae bacterium]